MPITKDHLPSGHTTPKIMIYHPWLGWLGMGFPYHQAKNGDDFLGDGLFIVKKPHVVATSCVNHISLVSSSWDRWPSLTSNKEPPGMILATKHLRVPAPMEPANGNVRKQFSSKRSESLHDFFHGYGKCVHLYIVWWFTYFKNIYNELFSIVRGWCPSNPLKHHMKSH